MTADKIILSANTENTRVALKNDEYITITINRVLQVSINWNDNFVYNVDFYSIQNDEVIGDTYVTDEDVLSEKEFKGVHRD